MKAKEEHVSGYPPPPQNAKNPQVEFGKQWQKSYVLSLGTEVISMEIWTLIREYCLNSQAIPNDNPLQPGVTEMVNYLPPYSFSLLSTGNKTGVLSELNSH